MSKIIIDREKLRYTFELPQGQICKEKNCNSLACSDYNGFGYWVCKYHFDKLNDEFDEEYK